FATGEGGEGEVDAVLGGEREREVEVLLAQVADVGEHVAQTVVGGEGSGGVAQHDAAGATGERVAGPHDLTEGEQVDAQHLGEPLRLAHGGERHVVQEVAGDLHLRAGADGADV